MRPFGGFPAKMRFAAVPEPFFSHVLPHISDIAELKATLTMFRIICQKRGYARFVALSELKSDVALMGGIAEAGKPVIDSLALALAKVVQRGTFVSTKVTMEGVAEDLFFLNSETDRRTMAKIESGELALPGVKVKEPADVQLEEERPGVFGLYEENIGLITPLIADELREAQRLYPETWVQEAIKEAATQNKRRWSYISAILERWNSEGRTDGTYRGDNKKADPDKYIKGKYGHMVQR